MRLLDRYLLGELLVPLVYCLAGFQIFWVAFDLFSNLQHYQDLNLEWKKVLEITLLRIPSFINTVLPIAFLLALLYTLTNLVRYNELVAMRAAGVSMRRVCVPFFVVALLLGGAVFVVNEYAFPRSNAKAERLRTAGPEAEDQWLDDPVNFRSLQGQTWFIARYNPAFGEMLGPQVEWEMDSSRMLLFADRAVWSQGTWLFFNAKLHTYTPAHADLPTTKQRFDHFEDRSLSGTPQQLQSEITIGRLNRFEAAKSLKLSLGDILVYKKLTPNMDAKREAMLMTQLHGRIAQPFTCLVVVLVALPFGASSGRRNLFAGVASSVGICFVYFILQRWCLAFGIGQQLDPLLAAWLPNILFAITGLGLLWLQETRSLEPGKVFSAPGKPAPAANA